MTCYEKGVKPGSRLNGRVAAIVGLRASVFPAGLAGGAPWPRAFTAGRRAAFQPSR